MEKTSKTKLKLSCRKKTNEDSAVSNDQPSNIECPSTPVSNKNSQSKEQNEFSPVYFQTTQESNEEIDVLWDWNSSQSSQQRRKKPKRIFPVHSPVPRFTVKRNVAVSSQQFEKLREELRALQQQLAIPDDEDSLIISPQQEVEIKKAQEHINYEKIQDQIEDYNDLMDDSLDAELFMFSQRIETELVTQLSNEIQPKQLPSEPTGNKLNAKSLPTTDLKKTSAEHLADDSFELALSSTNFDDIKAKLGSTSEPTEKNTFRRAQSENCFDKVLNDKSGNIIETISGKLELYRTKSFELDALSQNRHVLSSTEIERMEKKRLEALARLQTNKKQSHLKNNTSSALVDEIEKKRLQALAKLQAKKFQETMMKESKRLQEIVEKKRQEALMKLQRNRIKGVGPVKQTLTKRL